jgi:PAS domain S-box-containing protein
MKRATKVSASALYEHRRTIHELEVHKIELEMQNQAMREDRAQLEESRARYAELYDFAPVGYLTVDHAGAIRALNLACAELLGQERRSLLGKRLRVLLIPQSRVAFDAHVRAYLDSKSKRPATVELVVRLEGGGFRSVELLSTAPSPTDSRPRIFHAAMIDISARKRQDERRDQLLQRERAARALAETTNQVKRHFLAVVSHELRTPLVPMMMWIKALRAGDISDILRARAIEAIDTCLQAEVAMIDDLVDVARGEHGKLNVQRRPVDLQPIVSGAVEAVAPSAAAKQIELTLDVDRPPTFVAGDATRLRQVVGNLLSNAVKFTSEGGHIAVALRTRGDEIVLTVSDDGQGVDAASLEGIFEPFRQQETGTARRHGGLGLGLTIVRQLVDEHGGKVTVNSAGKGRGACFTVTLHRCDEPRIGGKASRWPLAQLPGKPLELTGVRILVVEDHADTREALEIALRSQGAVVTAAASAADARQALESAHPQVVVSDVGMPLEDGYTFMRKLRATEAADKARPRLPALALTAHSTRNDRALALRAGFDDHVAKPIDFDRLVFTIGALVRRGATAADR